MNPIMSKHILIGLAVTFILFLFCRIGDSYDQTGTQSPMQYQSFDRSMDWEQDYPRSSTWSYNPTSPTRHEILQTKVKGYREETYWGEQTSTAEKVRYMDDDEFKDDLYGATMTLTADSSGLTGPASETVTSHWQGQADESWATAFAACLAEDPDWYKTQCSLLNNVEWKIAQELDMQFVASESSFFRANIIEMLNSVSIEPEYIMHLEYHELSKLHKNPH